MCCMGSWASRFPLFVDGAKGVVDEVARGCGMDAEVARFLKSRVVGGSDRLARGVRSDERAAYTACQTIMLRCSRSRPARSRANGFTVGSWSTIEMSLTATGC